MPTEPAQEDWWLLPWLSSTHTTDLSILERQARVLTTSTRTVTGGGSPCEPRALKLFPKGWIWKSREVQACPCNWCSEDLGSCPLERFQTRDTNGNAGNRLLAKGKCTQKISKWVWQNKPIVPLGYKRVLCLLELPTHLLVPLTPPHTPAGFCPRLHRSLPVVGSPTPALFMCEAMHMCPSQGC